MAVGIKVRGLFDDFDSLHSRYIDHVCEACDFTYEGMYAFGRETRVERRVHEREDLKLDTAKMGVSLS
jgi:hypothetical protein